MVEVGETLTEAVEREVREETSLAIEPVALAGYREVVARDAQARVERHFVILPFAARWVSGEPVLNEELSEWCWVDPAAIAGLQTSPGLAGSVAAAMEHLAALMERSEIRDRRVPALRCAPSGLTSAAFFPSV